MGLIFHESTHTYELDGQELPSVTQVLQSEGFIDARWFTDYSRERGTLVHRIIQYHLNGELDENSIDPALHGYFDAWKKFEKETGYKAHTIEKPMASEQYRFAGTPDNIGHLVDETLLDVKTGAILPWVAIQLAAYEILCGSKVKRVAVHLKEDGTYCLKEFKNRQDRQLFLSVLACYQWKQNNLRR